MNKEERLKPLKEAGDKLVIALRHLVDSEYAYEAKPFHLELGDNIKKDRSAYDAALNDYNEAKLAYHLLLDNARKTSENKPI